RAPCRIGGAAWAAPSASLRAALRAALSRLADARACAARGGTPCAAVAPDGVADGRARRAFAVSRFARHAGARLAPVGQARAEGPAVRAPLPAAAARATSVDEMGPSFARPCVRMNVRRRVRAR